MAITHNTRIGVHPVQAYVDNEVAILDLNSAAMNLEAGKRLALTSDDIEQLIGILRATYYDITKGAL